MATQDETTVDWEPYHEMIWTKYIIEDSTLEETRRHLRTKGLKATIGQYKKRYSGHKHLKTYEWIAVAEELRKREQRGIESEVCLYGKVINPKKVQRGLRIHGNKPCTTASSKVVITRHSNRNKISIRTPRLRSPSLMALSAPSIPIELFEEPIHELGSGRDFDANRAIHSMDLDGITGIVVPSAEIYPFTNVGGEIIESSQTLHSSNLAMSMTGSVFNFGSADEGGTHEWSILFDLPWFELRGILEHQSHSTYSSINTPSSGLLRSPSLMSPNFHDQNRAITDVVLTNRRGLLKNILGCSQNFELTNFTSSLTSHLSPRVPERYEGELATKVEQFLKSSQKQLLHSLFELFAFFVSNNMASNYQISFFLETVIDQKSLPRLNGFLRIDSTTTRVLFQRILEPAVTLRNMELLQSLFLSGLDFRNIPPELMKIKDVDFVNQVLSRANAECLSGDSGGRLLVAISNTDNTRGASILMESGASIDYISSDEFSFNQSPLTRAVSNKSFEMVKLLLDRGADVNLKSISLEVDTPISIAILYGRGVEIISLLLDHGADINCTISGESLLDYASVHERGIYHVILERIGGEGAFITAGDILHAAMEGSGALSEYLACHGAKISKGCLESALGNSIDDSFHNIGAIVRLLDSGIDPNGPTLEERPLLRAARCEPEDEAICISKLLIDKGANVDVPGLLCEVIEFGYFDLLLMLLDAGADLKKEGPQALEKAATDDQIEAVAMLLDRGVDINAIGKSKYPIQAAARYSELELVDYLLGCGANVNAPAYSNRGRTALQSACEYPRKNMVMLLLANGADVNAAPATFRGVTALEAAMSSCATDAIKAELFHLLRAAGAEISCRYGQVHDDAIVHAIIREGLIDLLEIALDAGFQINQMSLGEEGRTPLQLAAEFGRISMAKILLERGALINAGPTYRYGRSALQAAASSSDPSMEMLRFLIHYGADVHASAGLCRGVTAIQGAAIAGSIPVVKYLLELGADVNSRPAYKKGRSAIEGAAEHGRLDIVVLLLQLGAKGDVTGRKGLTTAIRLATRNGHLEVANLLESAKRERESGL